jgi:hypothetical protein
MEMEYKISGIPCIIRVSHFESQKGSFSRDAASDLDYYGYDDIDWEVCDRRGRPAPWLDRKVTDRIEDEIYDALIKFVRGY